MRPPRIVHQTRGVAQRSADVGAAAELHLHDRLDRIGAIGPTRPPRWCRIGPDGFAGVRMPKKMAAVTAEWITLSAMLPDSSTTMMICQRSTCRRTREKK